MNTENQAEKHSAEHILAELAHIVGWLSGLANAYPQNGKFERGVELIKQIGEENKSLRAELSTLRKELEAAKKAQEWVQTHGLKFSNSYERHVNYQGEGLKNLRELLNNGKD